MSPNWAIAVGIFVGGMSGLLGVGGGAVLIPILTLFFAFTQKEAQGTSLAALLPPVGIFAVIQYYKQGYVRFDVALWVALGFAFGALGTSMLLGSIKNETLTRVFGLFMIFIGLRSVLFSDSASAATLFAAVGTLLVWLGFAWSQRVGQKWLLMAQTPKTNQDSLKDFQI